MVQGSRRKVEGSRLELHCLQRFSNSKVMDSQVSTCRRGVVVPLIHLMLGYRFWGPDEEGDMQEGP